MNTSSSVCSRLWTPLQVSVKFWRPSHRSWSTLTSIPCPVLPVLTRHYRDFAQLYRVEYIVMGGPSHWQRTWGQWQPVHVNMSSPQFFPFTLHWFQHVGANGSPFHAEISLLAFPSPYINIINHQQRFPVIILFETNSVYLGTEILEFSGLVK